MGGALVLVFMGASSLAFHRASTMNSPAHTLDIAFGWILVSHVFYVSFAVALLAGAKAATPQLDRRDHEAVRNVRFVLSVLFLVFVTVLMTLYDDFYRHQTTLYLVVGPAAAVFGAICRGILVYEEGKLQWPAVRLAIVELVVALTAVFAAIVCQGELLGRTLNRATTPEEYDFYHGQWHFLLALVVGLLYSRAADSARIVQGTHRVRVLAADARLGGRAADSALRRAVPRVQRGRRGPAHRQGRAGRGGGPVCGAWRSDTARA